MKHIHQIAIKYLTYLAYIIGSLTTAKPQLFAPMNPNTHT